MTFCKGQWPSYLSLSSLLLFMPSGVIVAKDPLPTYANVSYGQHPHQILDIYIPKDGTPPYPVFIWYGGLWQPAKHPVNLGYFAKENIAIVSVELRTFNDAIADKVSPPMTYIGADACRSVQFIRYNAKKYRFDPERIAVGGGSQGALPALYVATSRNRADATAKEELNRVSTLVTCVAAFRSQPSIDPKRMQEWVPGVEWGAPALGYSFKESLQKRNELEKVISTWSPDALLHAKCPPIYFENNWGLTKPEGIGETDYKVHSPAWALGFQKLAREKGVRCYVQYPGHPTKEYKNIWDFVAKELKK